MATDDIRAAAERLRFAACHPHSPIYGSDLVPLVDEVTKHILAAHPADDAEPVKSHGIDREELARIAQWLEHFSSDTELWRCADRLCRALGIELTE